MTITGKVVFQHIGPGFWGVIGPDGKKWRPSNMPKALQVEGLKVQLEASEAKSQMSVFMWGTGIDIKSYEVIT
ncbi:MAG TPA: hypothetical protein DCS93_24810 [Microscillaceae bacterium]|nr:hypothetical protein [Microscillaceae bacterium]